MNAFRPLAQQMTTPNQGKFCKSNELILRIHFGSFFEKISTGSNTDSDLRVVRFDGSAAKEIDSAEAFKDEDSLPKFRKPVPSKHQLSQQQMVNEAENQRRFQQQQNLLFEDFNSEVEGRASIDMMNMGELYQHK